ncbi:AMP-binding protein [bacterium]|nr:AMP-binding protein [bacterium]
MIFRSPYPPVSIPDVALTPFLLERVKRFGYRTAFVDVSIERKVSFAEFYDEVLACARGLDRDGLRKGDVFAIYSPNSIEYAVAFHAVSLLGGIVTTANPLCTSQELAGQLKDCRAKFLLTTPELVEKATEATNGSEVQEIFVAGESMPSGDGPLPDVSIHPKEDLIAMPYSSGTTGFPKGVMLTHRNLVANLLQIEASKVFSPEDVVICVLPLFHIYGLMVIMNQCLYLGCTNVMMKRYDLEQLLKNIETYGVTLAPLVPPIVLALAKQSVVSGYDLSQLKTIFCAAAPLSADLTRECSERIGCLIKQGYGMTEASPATHMSPYEKARIKTGSVGVCVPNTECKIVDDRGRELGVNQEGEILVRGPQVMKGYLNQPQVSASAIDGEGWLRTGDIGFADGEGNFYIRDRVKELIKYKGYQVAPAEIEAVLLTHPMIADAAVIPSADPEAGEVPKALVVLKGDVALQEIQDYVASRVAPYKKIRKIDQIDQIPKSPSGKILRRILVQRERGQ